MAKHNLKNLNFPDAPNIVIEPPGPKSKALIEKQQRFEGNAVSYPRGLPIAFSEGLGVTIKDSDGNVFIDFCSSAGVLNVGHCNPDVVQAVRAQVGKLTHALDFPTQPKADLVDELMEIAPLGLKGNSKVYFGGPTGSDAVEVAVKLAKINTQRFGLISFEGSYHGMTSGALALTSEKSVKEKQMPLLPEVHFIPYAYCYRCAFGLEYPGCGIQCALYLEHILENPSSGVVDPAAVIVEPVQGEGGTLPPPPEYMRELRRITSTYSIPLIADEIQAGIGRTGKMFSCEHSGTTPDIITFSKGIGGGLPISGIIFNKDLDTWKPRDHMGTFRGHVVAMAAAVAVLRFIKENSLLAHSERLGFSMLKQLKEIEDDFEYVGDIRGLGFMFGIEMVKDRVTKEPWSELASAIRFEMFKRGVIVEQGGHYGNVVRFLPSLTLTEDLANRSLDIFMDVLRNQHRVNH